jgi:hypothetical protein
MSVVSQRVDAIESGPRAPLATARSAFGSAAVAGAAGSHHRELGLTSAATWRPLGRWVRPRI